MASALCADTRAFLFPAGATTKSPLSSSTRETKRSRTTDENVGGPDAAPPLDAVVQDAKDPAVTTSTKARSDLGTVRTGHSLPAAWR